MERQEILTRFGRLKTWSQGGKRAPHKPLLVFYALGRLLNADERLVSFEESYPVLKELLQSFGPTRRSYHPEYPFWHLVNDGVWTLTNIEQVPLRNGGGSPSKKTLLQNGVEGGFDPKIYRLLQKDRSLCIEVARELLDAHFPPSVHEDIFQAVGIDTEVSVVPGKRKRDTRFRERVLRAYSYCCAVCGLDVRLGSVFVGLEAAHIKWHQAGGPDTEVNGLALCSLHHKLLDRGVYTLSGENRIVVSEQAVGSSGFEDWVLRYHGNIIRSPIRTEYHPKAEYSGWHTREVFQGPARQIDQ